MATNYQDFLGVGGTGVNVQANPNARPVDPNEQPNPANPGGISNNELARRKRALLQSSNLAAQGRQNVLDSGEKQVAAAPGKWGLSSTEASRKASVNAPNDLFGDIGTIWGSDPVTTAILAAPYAVGAAGALIPAAAAGPGITTPAIANPTLGSVGTMASPFGPGSGAPALGAVGTVPSPFAAPAAAGAAGALPAMAAPAAAGAGGIFGSGISPSAAISGLGAAVAGGQLLGSLFGGNSKEEDALLAKQKELAEATRQRQAQAEQERLNRLGQQLAAFNPRNQMMAQMFGPQAAYTPQQMAGLVGDAGANPALAGGAPGVNGSEEDILRANADARRRASVESAFSPVGPGPAPLQRRTPQAARRF